MRLGRLHVDRHKCVDTIAARDFPWRDLTNLHLLAVADLAIDDDQREVLDRLLAAQSLSEPVMMLTGYGKLAMYLLTVRIATLLGACAERSRLPATRAFVSATTR